MSRYRRKWWWAVGVALAALVTTGCQTAIEKKAVSPGVWVVRDTRGNGGAQGANPEKGLPMTCFAQHRPILGYRRTNSGKSLIVYCGAPSSLVKGYQK